MNFIFNFSEWNNRISSNNCRFLSKKCAQTLPVNFLFTWKCCNYNKFFNLWWRLFIHLEIIISSRTSGAKYLHVLCMMHVSEYHMHPLYRHKASRALVGSFFVIYFSNWHGSHCMANAEQERGKIQLSKATNPRGPIKSSIASDFECTGNTGKRNGFRGSRSNLESQISKMRRSKILDGKNL